MPYILKIVRDRLKRGKPPSMKDVGELNYELTLKAIQFFNDHGRSYATYNSIVGAFECAKLELYRRMITPYENLKQLENGDIDGYAEQEKQIQRALAEHFKGLEK